MMLKPLSVLARMLLGSVLLALAPFLYAADSTGSADGAVLRMHFLTNSAGETLLRYNDLTPALLSKQTNKLVNATQLAATKGAQFSMIPDDVPVNLTSDQFPGWQADIPMKQSLRFGFDYVNSILDLETSDLNRQPIGLSFSDGAKAQMNGKSEGRLEVMNDGTYAFFGAGPVSGVTADGVPIRFGTVFPPLFGGKLIAPKGTNANARFARATPVTQLTFFGTLDSNLRAKIGNQVVALERDVPQELTAENGARISLVFNASRRTLDWTVQRGLFRFTVGSFSCWKALGTSGQSASMQWDTNSFLMEIKNHSGPNAFQKSLLVNLNPTLNVAVGDSATLQYGRTGDCSTFVATAYGGETILYNAQTGRYVRLDEGNMSIVSGTPENVLADSVRAPKTKVRLGWATDDQVELRGTDGSVKVPLNGDGSFSSGGNQDLKVNYQGKDQLILRAETGGFAVTPDVLPGISIEISEGSAVALGLDRGNDIFRLQPLISNVTPVDLRTQTGFYPNLRPGVRITFLINRSTFTSDGDEGSLIFTETAGAPTLTGDLGFTPVFGGRGDVTFFGGTSSNLSEPRVDQPPVTTIQ